MEQRLIDANALAEVLKLKLSKMSIVPLRSVMEIIVEAPTIDAKPVQHGAMRVEVERFEDYWREHYFCPSCGIELGHKTWNERYQFGQGTVLKNNKFPHYCPNCGAKMGFEGG